MAREPEKNKKDTLRFLGHFINLKTILLIVILVLIAAGSFGLGKYVFSESKTTKIGFENIGELATQSAYCTVVNVTEASREMFGVQIPFTQSKYVYSYDVLIKAGYDFGEIQWSENEHTIQVKLPEAKILSSELDLDSLKVYHEKESAFRHISLSENNEAMTKMKEKAQEDAIANGLLDNARANAETILTGFFAGTYDLGKYEIVFTDR